MSNDDLVTAKLHEKNGEIARLTREVAALREKHDALLYQYRACHEEKDALRAENARLKQGYRELQQTADDRQAQRALEWIEQQRREAQATEAVVEVARQINAAYRGQFNGLQNALDDLDAAEKQS